MVKRLTNPFRDRPTPLGSLLSAAGQRLSAELDRALHDAGFPDLRSAHAPVFMAIDPEGTRITELAERTHMTKQAMGELVRYLSSLGYIAVEPDANDRRVRRVSLTARGWEAIDVGRRAIDEFDAWLATTIGSDEVARMRQTLDRIIASR